MNIEDHVGCAISYFGHWMCGHVVKQVVDPLACVFCWFVLLRGDVGERHKYCWVDCASIVEEAADNLLDVFFTVFIEEWAIIDGVYFLVIFTIFDGVW